FLGLATVLLTLRLPAAWADPAAAPPPTPPASSTPSNAEVLTLDQCLRLAFERSPDYGGAEARLDASRGGVGLARSRLLPQLTLSTDASRVSAERIFFSGLGGEVRAA